MSLFQETRELARKLNKLPRALRKSDGVIFEAWKDLIDNWFEQRCGMSTGDFEDYGYWSLYDDNYSVKEAAEEVWSEIVDY